MIVEVGDVSKDPDLFTMRDYSSTHSLRVLSYSVLRLQLQRNNWPDVTQMP
jgi:hypothetical protein